jgi:hypothetical protein
MKGTDFKGALVKNTTFQYIDLSKTKGLGSMIHRGPSTIGIDTFYMSKGKLPESFLRGCGVPEIFIQHMDSLTLKAFDFYSCFISYPILRDESIRQSYLGTSIPKESPYTLKTNCQN